MEPFVPEMLKRRMTEFICGLKKGFGSSKKSDLQA